jgi:predicted DNA-binding transcriptional regulator AlpA
MSTEQLPRRVILRIIEAVDLIGVSHDHIARELTDDAVPNPSGGTRWDASTIRAVLASKAAAAELAPRKPATSTVEHFDDPASAPFGASTAITVTDPDGGFGMSYTNAAGDWVGCVIGVALPPDETETEP